VENEIGHGGSSVVYLARDREGDRVVAIKVLRQELAVSVTANRFLREVRLLADLAHPNIIPVLDSGEYEGRLFVVLPFMDGGTLRTLLDHDSQLPVARAVDIACTLCEALSVAHQQGVIHRDVKPENVLFSGDTPYLADFGIARAIERALEETTTTTGVVIGTPAYMSPEQAAGEKQLNARSDVYSLACVVYEMLAGMQAFTGPSRQSIIAQRMTHGPRPLQVYRPSVPKALAEVIDKAMKPEPADRFQTAAEFGEALKASLEIRPQDSPHTPRRSRRPLAGILTLAVAAGVGIAVLARRETLARNGPPTAVKADPSIRLAVAPFDFFDAADSVWRRGLVDVLSRNFDGLGPLRAVPATLVMKGWKGPADDSTAASLAKATGAELVVYGQLRRATRDTARVVASILDVRHGKVYSVDRRDHVDNMDRLSDSVTVALIRELYPDMPIASARRPSLGTRSLAVLKLFLQGEQLLRTNDPRGAREKYEQAVREDSAFALGYHRLRTVARSLGSEFDSASLAYALHAGRLNRGLSPRDSLLLAADSLSASLPTTLLLYDADAQRRLKARFATLERAAAAYPEDPEIWEELGEARLHHGNRVGETPERALQAFERAVALDPAYRPPYSHTVELSLGLRGADSAARVVRQYLKGDSSDTRFRIVAALLAADIARRPVDWSAIGRFRPEDLSQAGYLTRRWLAAIHISEQLYRMVAASDAPAATPLKAGARVWLATELTYQGRPRAAAQFVTQANLERDPYLALTLARAGALSRPEADTLFAGSLRTGNWFLLLTALPWWNGNRDSAHLAAAGRRFDSLAASQGAKPTERMLGRYGAIALQMYAALARGDSARALKAARELPDSLCGWPCTPQRLTHAWLLVGSGHTAEAATYLDAHPPPGSPHTVSEVEWHLDRARIAVRDRKPDVASGNYQFIVNAWSDAEPPFRAAADEARAWLRARTAP
jgi:serine/threonine-protein kinase